MCIKMCAQYLLDETSEKGHSLDLNLFMVLDSGSGVSAKNWI